MDLHCATQRLLVRRWTIPRPLRRCGARFRLTTNGYVATPGRRWRKSRRGGERKMADDARTQPELVDAADPEARDSGNGAAQAQQAVARAKRWHTVLPSVLADPARPH